MHSFPIHRTRQSIMEAVESSAWVIRACRTSPHHARLMVTGQQTVQFKRVRAIESPNHFTRLVQPDVDLIGSESHVIPHANIGGASHGRRIAGHAPRHLLLLNRVMRFGVIMCTVTIRTFQKDRVWITSLRHDSQQMNPSVGWGV